ncbi:MAG TPA: PCYCGC motif-containing (lipo)protein [Candidatus Obscuribacterales bacterium]
MREFLAALLIMATCALSVFAKPVAHSTASKTAVTTQQTALANTIWDYSRTKGNAHASYAAAKAEPELMSKLFCYCGCDVVDKMTSLLTCFQSNHSVDCSICQDEALYAFNLKKTGSSDAEIRKQLDRHFSHLYPFTKDSEIFKKYKATAGR